MLTTLEDVSKTLKGKVVMSYSDANDQLGSRLAEFVGYSAGDKPNFVMVVFEEDDLKKYFYEGEMNADDLVAFV